MAILFRCTSCGREMTIDDSAAGQRTECPHCRNMVLVPGGNAPASSGPVVAETWSESRTSRIEAALGFFNLRVGTVLLYLVAILIALYAAVVIQHRAQLVHDQLALRPGALGLPWAIWALYTFDHALCALLGVFLVFAAVRILLEDNRGLRFATWGVITLVGVGVFHLLLLGVLAMIAYNHDNLPNYESLLRNLWSEAGWLVSTLIFGAPALLLYTRGVEFDTPSGVATAEGGKRKPSTPKESPLSTRPGSLAMPPPAPPDEARGSRLRQAFLYGLGATLLSLAIGVAVARGLYAWSSVTSYPADQLQELLRDPFYILYLVSEGLSVFVALYVAWAAWLLFRDEASGCANLIPGLVALFGLRVLHFVLFGMLYRDRFRLPLSPQEEGTWLVGAAVVSVIALVLVARLPQIKFSTRFSVGSEGGAGLAQSLFAKALHSRASDLHVEPGPGEATLRVRVDGILHSLTTLPRTTTERLISHVKVMGQMDIAERRLPQDGQASIRVDGHVVDMRLSTVPSAYGERLVVRFLDREAGLLGLRQLGMAPDQVKLITRITNSSQGVFFCTGPTGAGKSTTLYASLLELNKEERNVITLEDPIEYTIPGITQLPVSRKKGMNFASALRSILRQDPDVIMVGEVRDEETATMVIQAAQTGHLVLSTLHTNDAAGAVSRMLDLGVEPYLLASSLRAVLAQRLVRRVCPDCATTCEADAEELALLGRDPGAELSFRKGAGCPKCLHTGYYGRVGLFELLVVEESVRALITQRADAVTIRSAAVVAGMVTLRMDGVRKAQEGLTTLDEVLRVTESDVMV